MKYEKPKIVKKDKMNFPLDILFGSIDRTEEVEFLRQCKQCSSCHNCR